MYCGCTWFVVVCLVFSLLAAPGIHMSYSTKKIVYMDEEMSCDRIMLDDGLSEGDSYEINSDRKVQGGLSKWSDRQHELICPIGFNFGDRFVALVIKIWMCEDGGTDSYLAVYSDCHARQNGLLKWLNSSHKFPLPPIYSPGSCVSLIYKRGQKATNGGCHFQVDIIARYEKFPAYKVAAIVVSCIVLLMLVVKIACVITGYERRLPNLSINPEEDKFILNHDSSTEQLDVIQVHQQANSGDNMAQASNAAEDKSPTLAPPRACQSRSHRLVSLTRSTGSEGRASLSAELSSELDLYDLPSTPRLKRYPSAKASSIWHHK